MKRIMNITASVQSFICAILLLTNSENALCQNAESVDALIMLTQRVKKDSGSFPSETYDKDVESFNLLIADINFEPKFEAPVDIKVATHDSKNIILTATELVIAILRSENTKNLNLKTSSSPSIAAIDSFWGKLNRAIDPNWKMLHVTANVGPAPGTPNAAAGMNPDAIADPDLKRKYLKLIKTNRDNNLRNGQQRALRDSRDKFLRVIAELILSSGEKWNKTDVVARYCKDEESKKILEKHLKQNE